VQETTSKSSDGLPESEQYSKEYVCYLIIEYCYGSRGSKKSKQQARKLAVSGQKNEHVEVIKLSHPIHFAVNLTLLILNQIISFGHFVQLRPKVKNT